MSESILAILDRESIRLMDGRYSTGFANMEDLQKLIDMGGYVEVYENQGVKFVRKHIVPSRPTKHALDGLKQSRNKSRKLSRSKSLASKSASSRRK